MQTDIHKLEDYEFDTDTCTLCGGLSYNLTEENFFDADIGGTDGPEFTAEIIGLQIGSQLLTRDMLVAMSSETGVASHEDTLGCPDAVLEAA